MTTRDKITEPLRQVVHPWVLYNRDQRRARAIGQPMPPPTNKRAAKGRVWVHTLIRCDWCVGFWWSALVGVLAHRYGKTAAFRLPATVLTASYALGMLAEHEEPRPPMILKNQEERARAPVSIKP